MVNLVIYTTKSPDFLVLYSELYYVVIKSHSNIHTKTQTTQRYIHAQI
jgi:hypothetical protein